MLFFLKTVFLIFSLGISAQEIDSTKQTLSQINKESLIKKMTELSNISEEKLEAHLEKFNKDIEYYIQSRQKECQGEFTSIEINSSGESETFKRKLSKDEKRRCLLELIRFRKKYITEVYKLRVKVLKLNHKKQIEQLLEAKAINLKSLDELSEKIKKK